MPLFRLSLLLLLAVPADGLAAQDDTATPRILGEAYRYHDDAVSAAAFSADGKRALTAGWDGTVWVHDATTGASLGRYEVTGMIVGAAFGGAGGSRVFACTEGGTVEILDATSGKVIRTLKDLPTVRVAGAADGSVVVAWDETGRLILLEGPTGETLAEITVEDAAKIGFPAVSAGGERAAVSTMDGELLLFDLQQRKATARRELRSASSNLAWMPDGEALVFGSYDILWVEEAATGEERHVLQGFNDLVKSPVPARDGASVFFGTLEGSIYHVDLADAKLLHFLGEHRGIVQVLAPSPDGGMLLTSDMDGPVRFWNLADWSRAFEAPGHADMVLDLAFSPDGGHLASTAWDNSVALWAVGSGELVAFHREHESSVSSVAFTGDGSFWTVGDDGRMLHHDAEGAVVGEVTVAGEAKPPALSIAVLPDGAILTGHYDGRIVFRDAEGAETDELARDGAVAELEPAADGSRIAAPDGSKAFRFVAIDGDTTGQELNMLDTAVRDATWIDGETVAVITDDGHLRVRTAGRGTELRAVPVPGLPTGEEEAPPTTQMDVLALPGRDLVVTVGEAGLSFFRASDLEALGQRPIDGFGLELAVDPEGALLAIGLADSRILIHELDAIVPE